MFGFLAVATMILLFFVGIPALGRFAAFVSELGKTNKPIDKTDNTPPAPPKFDNFDEFTSQTSVNITGSSESGATIKLTFNGEAAETVANDSGKFSFNNMGLTDGENIFSAMAVDAAGNTSVATSEQKIVFDDEKPELVITTPGEGTQFFGSSQRQVTIKAESEEDVEARINDRIISVDSEGNFQYTTTLSEGENKFKIKATDKAGNSEEIELTVSFTP